MATIKRLKHTYIIRTRFEPDYLLKEILSPYLIQTGHVGINWSSGTHRGASLTIPIEFASDEVIGYLFRAICDLEQVD
jgi:hypothetical protein